MRRQLTSGPEATRHFLQWELRLIIDHIFAEKVVDGGSPAGLEEEKFFDVLDQAGLVG